MPPKGWRAKGCFYRRTSSGTLLLPRQATFFPEGGIGKAGRRFGNSNRQAWQRASGPRRAGNRYGAATTSWRSEDGVRQSELVRRLVSQPGTERRDDEARTASRRRREVGKLCQALPGRDDASRCSAHHRGAGNTVSPRKFLARLLLPGRIALPSIDSFGPAEGTRGGAGSLITGLRRQTPRCRRPRRRLPPSTPTPTPPSPPPSPAPRERGKIVVAAFRTLCRADS